MTNCNLGHFWTKNTNLGLLWTKNANLEPRLWTKNSVSLNLLDPPSHTKCGTPNPWILPFFKIFGRFRQNF